MGVYQTKEFAKFARKAKVESADLLVAAADVAEGRWDANLGGGVFKQRIGRKGGGKSGGFRTIIVCRMGAHSFFVHGFAKNQKANISAKELDALKKLATVLLALDVEALETAIAAGEISEVTGRP
ncbi:type II toxin-antitoxin system RelE/ParE family toxin [Rhodopseudomonas parapalustris]